MKTDEYLVKWLRAAFMDVDGAKEMLENVSAVYKYYCVTIQICSKLLIDKQNIRWRKDKRIDGILEEDLSPVPKQFKVHHGGHDRDGRPCK